MTELRKLLNRCKSPLKAKRGNYELLEAYDLKRLEFLIRVEVNRGWWLNGSIFKDGDKYYQAMIIKAKKGLL